MSKKVVSIIYLLVIAVELFFYAFGFDMFYVPVDNEVVRSMQQAAAEKDFNFKMLIIIAVTIIAGAVVIFSIPKQREKQ